MKKVYGLTIMIAWILLLQWCASQQAQPQEVVTPKPVVEIAEDLTTVEIVTDYGTMEAILYDNTPKHRDNFIKLASKGFYNDLLFHRVIEWFMIQWGDPDSRGAEAWVALGRWWPWYQIDAEIDKPHFKGTLAAARTWWPSNPQKRSSGSQFYIVQGTPQTQASLASLQAQKWITYTPEQIEKYIQVWWTPMLDNDYTVFGEVTAWLDVIDAIAAVQTAPGDRPTKDVTMQISIK